MIWLEDLTGTMEVVIWNDVYTQVSEILATGRVIEVKGFDTSDAVLRKAIGEQILKTLRAFRKRQTVEQVGLGRGVRWKLASEA